jgi:hypothetical protein
MKSEYMELSFIPKCNGYYLRHRQEKMILSKYLEEESVPKFFEMLKELKKTSPYSKQRWLIRLIRLFQITTLLLMIGTFVLFVMCYSDPLVSYFLIEKTFLAFCAAVTLLFFTVFLTLVLEMCFIPRQIE